MLRGADGMFEWKHKSTLNEQWRIAVCKCHTNCSQRMEGRLMVTCGVRHTHVAQPGVH